MADYQEPSWAQAPGHAWALVEIKNGTEIARHVLSKSCVLLGRAADMVDIVLYHESCSRRHARVAFDSRGVPWLRDLGSAHGVTVNKKPLPAPAIGKVESVSTKTGSRGVVLFPGDVMQFGASTRLFCVQGLPQFERGAIKALQQQQQATQAEGNHTFHQREIDDEPEQPKTLDENSIPPQHYKAWEGLKARRYKLQNLQTENERIEVKGELTEGQERQLERNRQRMASLQEEIDEMEQELLNKIYPGAKGTPKSLFNAATDEDDVDDRTSGNRRLQTNEAETEESLVAKWKQDHQEYMRHGASMTKAEGRLYVLEEKVKAAGDEEERFFLQNDVDLARDVYKKAKQHQDEIMSDVKETEQLLQIVNSKIGTDLETGSIGTEVMAPARFSKEMPPPSFSSLPPAASKSMPPPSFAKEVMLPPPASKSMPPPSFAKEAMPPPVAPIKPKPMPPPSLSKYPSNAMLPPPPKRQSTSDAAEITNANTDVAQNELKAKRPRIVGPAMPPPAARRKVPAPTGTLAFLSATENQSKAVQEKKAKPSDSGFDAKKDEWRAPVGQDGSGRTKLNEKFSGRY